MSDAEMKKLRIAGMASYWLDQSQMWLAELPSYGVPAAAINNLRQNARAAVHDAIEATERENAFDLSAAQARIAELEAALRVYADGCDATPNVPCGYEGNMCCQTARRALEAKP